MRIGGGFGGSCVSGLFYEVGGEARRVYPEVRAIRDSSMAWCFDVVVPVAKQLCLDRHTPIARISKKKLKVLACIPINPGPCLHKPLPSRTQRQPEPSSPPTETSTSEPRVPASEHSSPIVTTEIELEMFSLARTLVVRAAVPRPSFTSR